jgi:hypothetical protein
MWNDLGPDTSRLAARHRQKGTGRNENPPTTWEEESIKMRGIAVLIKLSLIFKQHNSAEVPTVSADSWLADFLSAKASTTNYQHGLQSDAAIPH